MPGRAQTEVGEEPEHFMVLTQRVGRERGDAVRAGGGDQVLDEKGAHPRWCTPSATATEISAVSSSPLSYSASPITRPCVSASKAR
ncbi:hypothetical protein STAFG_2354 [Streptomyces afghaniensis 772]|uniref:Uncharacterized protein n=1 Tax=Streptomyces afghaniensis 772 TaxID=1283301 RepID=S4MXD7_9ACTN|nr:hypothetical protein STAFG_2354 [Streptomyces afghaniensis 772]